MTKVIAFTGVSNVGKTGIINELAMSYDVKVYDETATRLMPLRKDKDLTRFEKEIIREEEKRLYELFCDKQDSNADLILVDRTYLDAYLYADFNNKLGICKKISRNDYCIEQSKAIYDCVILFDTPLMKDKKTTLYDNDEFIQDFGNKIEKTYNATRLKNVVESKKDVYDIVNKYVD